MIRYLFCLLFAAILWTSTVCAADSDEALQSAQAWLALVDKGEIHQTWEQASTLSKRAVSASEWEKAIANGRGMMGEIKNRTRKTLYLDNNFHEFLSEKSENTGTPISRIVEIATIKQYQDEYDKFLEKRKGGEEQ